MAAIKRRKGPGKPPTLTAEKAKKIVDLVKAGVPLPLAAPASGVPWPTCANWLLYAKRGRGPEAKPNDWRWVAFQDDVDEAKAIYGAGLALRHGACAKDDPKAIQWALEKRFPEHYRPPSKVELSGPDGQPLGVQLRDAIERKRAQRDSKPDDDE